MDPDVPSDAQQIVNAYAAVLERQYSSEDGLPISRSTLPYPKDTIKQSIETVTSIVVTSGQLTDDLRRFLEHAYTSLADCVDDELARVMREYRNAMADLAATGGLGREKTGTSAWLCLSESGALVARIAQAMAAETETLRKEFRALERLPAANG